jgi:hypothetical protein
MGLESTYTTNNMIINNEPDNGFEKRVEKYLKMSHRTLAEMLAMRDEEKEKHEEGKYPYAPLPNVPYQPYQPYIPINTKWCPVSTGGVCTNPFGDCINCPYHGGVSYCQYNSNTTNSTSDLKPQFTGKPQTLKD